MRGMNHAIPAIDTVRDYLTGLQDRICAAIEAADGHARFMEDAWRRADDDASTHLRGGGRTRVLRDGAVFEQAGIGFSDVSGTRLPPSATAARPEQPAAVANKPDARPPRKEKPEKKTAAKKTTATTGKKKVS